MIQVRNSKSNNGGRVLIRKVKGTKRLLPSRPEDPRNTEQPDKFKTSTTGKISSIQIAHVNINGIRNKMDSISAELLKYDIICISETKLNNTVQTRDLELDGFRLPLRKDRQTNSGGGLIIYINNNIAYKRRQDLESNNIENMDRDYHPKEYFPNWSVL